MSDRMERLRTLIDSLVKGTRAGTVQWTPTDMPHAFSFAGLGGAVLLSKTADLYAAHGLTILDQFGNKVDGYAPQRPADQAHPADDAELRLRDALAELYSLVAADSPESRRVVDTLIKEVQRLAG